ncbi:MAG: hypothetical protein RIC16_04595 [Rhodospirillales bacterium]
MPKYRESFNLNITDVNLIEEALTKRASEVSRALLEQQPAAEKSDSIASFKRELEEIRSLLGRIHNQKIWYQPRSYVPQG